MSSKYRPGHINLTKLPNFWPDLRTGDDPDETEGRAMYRGRANMQASATSRKVKLRNLAGTNTK